MCVRFTTSLPFCSVFFFNDTATTEIYPLPLPDALPIFLTITATPSRLAFPNVGGNGPAFAAIVANAGDRKSTRLNSSHQIISYAVFCLKKKTTPIYKELYAHLTRALVVCRSRDRKPDPR